MIKQTIDRIRDAEVRAEKLVRDAEAGSQARMRDFVKERASRIKVVSRKNEALRQKRIDRAEEEAGIKEAEILSRAQEEMNILRAASDKKTKEAVSLIMRRVLGQ